MTPALFEAKVLKLVDDLLQGRSSESTFHEFKKDWPNDHARAARRIAGQCNASRGDTCAWIIGVDENAKRIAGVNVPEMASWWPQVQAHFAGHSPELLLNIAVQTNEGTICALLFSTSRPPYLVRNPMFGSKQGETIEFEVPWREGNAVKTARRDQLLRVLVAEVAAPEIEVVCADLRSIDAGTTRWSLVVELYVTPQTRERVVFPFHRMRVSATLERRVSMRGRSDFDVLRRQYRPGDEPIFPTDNSLSRTIQVTGSEIIIDGPGFLTFTMHFNDHYDLKPTSEIDLDVNMPVAGSDSSSSFSSHLPQLG